MSGSKHRIRIGFEDPDSWEDNREKINQILEKDTGTSEYPALRCFPPMIIGPEVSQEAYDELKGLHGVKIDDLDDD